jgi:hypothetical protein
MLRFSRLMFNAALVTAITAFSASALSAEVMKFQASGPSMSAEFSRITPIVCADGTESVREESIFISAARFRDKVDGEQIRTESAFATIFALDGCTGTFSVGSGDFTDFDYSQASVQRARFSGSTEVLDFATGASMGVLLADFVLEGVGPVTSGVDHIKTTELGNYRMIEVIQGQARDSALTGTVTLDAEDLVPFFISPINSLTSGHYIATIVTSEVLS